MLGLLTRWGLVVEEAECYSLTDVGASFEEEICSLFYSERVRSLLNASA